MHISNRETPAVLALTSSRNLRFGFESLGVRVCAVKCHLLVKHRKAGAIGRGGMLGVMWPFRNNETELVNCLRFASLGWSGLYEIGLMSFCSERGFWKIVFPSLSMKKNTLKYSDFCHNSFMTIHTGQEAEATFFEGFNS